MLYLRRREVAPTIIPREFRYLVAGTSPLERKSIISAVSSIGGKIVGEASTGAEVIRLFQRLVPDIVFMDVAIPESDGLTVTERLIQARSDARVILVSSSLNQFLIRRAFTCGASHLLIKPLKDVPLEEIVNFVLTE